VNSLILMYIFVQRNFKFLRDKVTLLCTVYAGPVEMSFIDVANYKVMYR
jgi:hypothetical protein